MAKKSKRGGSKKGKKGKGKSKSKKKGKKKAEVTPEVKEPLPPDTFFWVRRKTTSLLVETTDEMTVEDLRIMVATIFGYLPQDIQLFKDGEELQEKEAKKKEEGKDKDKDRRASKSKDKKGAKDKKSKDKGQKSKKELAQEAEDKKPKILTIADYGLTATATTINNPLSIAVTFRDKEGTFEELEVEPWTKPMEIPEIVKPYLRNYIAELDPLKQKADNISTGTSGGANKAQANGAPNNNNNKQPTKS